VLEGRLGSAPSTTIGVENQEYEIVQWVDMAYQDIQNDQEEWRFRTKHGGFNTVASQREYTITVTDADFEKLLPSMAQSDTRFILGYKTSLGQDNEQRIWFLPYEVFQQGIFDQGQRPEAFPNRFTINPAGLMVFDPTPDDIYSVTFDYRRTLHAMTTNSDATTGTPIIPARFHNAIVWRALMYHALTRDNTGESYEKWGREYAREMRQLRFDQGPELTLLEGP
jgi:hypothetical protein